MLTCYIKVAKLFPEMKETGSEDVSAHWSYQAPARLGGGTGCSCCEEN